ncbi:MAG: hypothetical protein U9N44_02355 [Chloroflexota bacterium]|nr:hypothetical protein [Chloroflexota bacterium]
MKGKSSNKTTSKVPNQKLSAKDEEFIKYHRDLRGEIDNANWHFTTWKYLWNAVENNLDEMNVAHTFFRLTMRGHLLETLLRLSKICNRGVGTLSMPDFLDFVKKDLDVFSKRAVDKGRHGEEGYEIEMEVIAVEWPEITDDLVDQHLRRIEALPLGRLKEWTKQTLSHVDKKVAKKDISVFEECPVDIEQVDTIIETVHEILNVYSAAYDGQTWDKDLTFVHGIQNLLNAVRAGKAAKP